MHSNPKASTINATAGDTPAVPVSANNELPIVIGVLQCDPLMWNRDSGDSTQEHGDVYIKIECPFCGRKHRHGWSMIGPRIEQRVAHCSIGSRYYIRPAWPGELGFDLHGYIPWQRFVRQRRQRQ